MYKSGILAVVAVALTWCGQVRADEQFVGDPTSPINSEAADFFETQIRPLLAEHCYSCHGEKKQRGGLRLDSRKAIIEGADAGEVVTPGDPDNSKLINAIHHNDEIKMPPKGKLADDEIEALTAWVEMGLPWPGEDEEDRKNKVKLRKDWAYQPIQDPAIPNVKDSVWPVSPVDYFILAKLEEKRITPSRPADKRTLLRRAYFDLIGLPPTPDEIDAFLADDSQDAFTRVVDQLLESPRYGERWARHWLDVARFGETKGSVFDTAKEEMKYPYAYTYRDWVIRAFNDDLPYNEFITRQLSADHLELGEDKSDLAALGFLTVGRRFVGVVHDVIDDRIDVVSRGMLGLTVTCARCHDHKYDPIPTADYYSFYGIFASSKEPDEYPLIGPEDSDRRAMVLNDADEPSDSPVFIKGSPEDPGDIVPRRFLQAIAGPEQEPFQNGSGRFDLANAIIDPANPFTARVMVNRIWLHHFGYGIVRTPSDFGRRSDLPWHLDLLDYLASRFMENGWSIKQMHRMIVVSSTYQQASTENPEYHNIDPENRLHWKFDRHRMDIESLRDALLAVSGQLDVTMEGPSEPLTSNRRTIYGFVDRQNLPIMLRVFDFASPDTHNPQRYTTTVPQQALFLMNSPFVGNLAQSLSVLPGLEARCDDNARIQYLYRLLYGRPATKREEKAGIGFLNEVEQENALIAQSRGVWKYGYGEANDDEVKSFDALTFNKDDIYQIELEVPESEPIKISVWASGGQPGEGKTNAAIRRWVAPREGEISISGTFHHPVKKGDGVQGRIIVSGQGQLGSWHVHDSQVETEFERLAVSAGDTIDFVVESGENGEYDAFSWAAIIRMLDTPTDADVISEWNAADDFSGPATLSAWAEYAQVLMLTNEFVFID